MINLALQQGRECPVVQLQERTDTDNLAYNQHVEMHYPTFHSGSLQGDELQPFPSLRDQQRQPQQQQLQQPFAPYEPEMVYSISPQGPAQAPYEVVTPYSARPSAAIDDLSGQFPVPQYFSPNEPTGAGVPAVGVPYLTSAPTYNQPGPIGRPTGSQPFPTTMTDMPPGGTAGRFDSSSSQQRQQQQQQTQQASSQVIPEPTTLTDAYGQFQRALRGTLDNARTGRLEEASRSLLEISEWLVTNARELAVCQKQKDLLQDVLRTRRQPPHTSLLNDDVMDNLGKELIQLCDRVEQFGLVDYQMGIWEEEILGVLGQCLDLYESLPEVLRAHMGTAPAIAGPRS
ncbi:hypothetical protein BDV27DRAFT_150848 [Aspergillus caelatus]|uniref:Uncharacterized protein n=1 Tax=Aspergillus caelatus TaxID=61420 RepID=A0A5N6ZK38_9EURO|nr:uncharacterized protein BDV27DRAFT_150848 [Aspergillus caelatus]KAE8357994.1 hypothetical protein BDV27DRAFT_150848 [Aspergillus caelatus]